jgi:hypothetical protein
LLFANRYGWLGAPDRVALDGTEEDGYWDEPVESFKLWSNEINLLSKAVGIWDTGKGVEHLPGLIDRGMNGRDAAFVEDGPPNRVTPRFARDPLTGKMDLQVMPKNLLGALWLQLAEAIGGGKKFRQCDTCGGWFEVAPRHNRADRQFCTDACRSRAYRGRQDRARQLAAEGRRLPAIAKELGSDVKTVRKWVTGR